jgi:hypothetical protein
VILVADLLCREHGGRLRVTQLLGPGIYSSGTAADVMALRMPIPDAPKGQADTTLHPRWLVQRLNLLYPFGEGDIETALFIPATSRIRLRVPIRGYRPDSAALSSWAEFGCTPGEVKNPRKVYL